MRDYPTYSGLMLEKYFRQKLTEEREFREMGSWWEAKAGKEACEIDSFNEDVSKLTTDYSDYTDFSLID